MPAVLNLPTDRRRNSATHAPRRAALTGDYAALVEPAPDEITVAEAARILSCDEAAVPRLLRRHDLLHEPLTRNGIEELSLRRWRRAHSRWPNSYWGTRDQAAAILGVNRARVGQLVKAGLVPYERTPAPPADTACSAATSSPWSRTHGASAGPEYGRTSPSSDPGRLVAASPVDGVGASGSGPWQTVAS